MPTTTTTRTTTTAADGAVRSRVDVSMVGFIRGLLCMLCCLFISWIYTNTAGAAWQSFYRNGGKNVWPITLQRQTKTRL